MILLRLISARDLRRLTRAGACGLAIVVTRRFMTKDVSNVLLESLFVQSSAHNR
jgi:hypothetical protein